jgi:rod shape determining protein RodA
MSRLRSVLAGLRPNVDWLLLVGILMLFSLSLLVLYSAGGEEISVLLKQGLRMVAALSAMLVIAQFSPQALRRWSPLLFLFGLALLLVVLGVGVIGKGAQRWIDLQLIRFQPSEVMKLAVPMAVAWLFARQSLPPRIGSLVAALALILVPTLLIVAQPDLGTALLIAASGLFVVFLAGISWRWIGLAGLLAAAAAPLAWTQLHAYQKQRILTLFDPWVDPLGAGYHSIQSMIAVGSGGMVGKGWLQGSQSQLEFIPERATDFVFAVYGEEFGLLGALVLLAIYLFLCFRGLVIANNAKDNYSRLLGGSVALTLFLYVFVNIGMVTAMLPVVGVPLPLISYGGTSMVTLMAGFGILMSINADRKLISH